MSQPYTLRRVALAALVLALASTASAGVVSTSGSIAIVDDAGTTLDSSELGRDATASAWLEKLVADPGAQTVKRPATAGVRIPIEHELLGVFQAAVGPTNGDAAAVPAGPTHGALAARRLETVAGAENERWSSSADLLSVRTLSPVRTGDGVGRRRAPADSDSGTLALMALGIVGLGSLSLFSLRA